MNIATSYEWFVWYCVRSLDFCNIPFCQMIFFINSLYYQWKSVEKISGKGSKIYWHVPSLYLKKLKRFLTEIYDENSGSFIHSEVFGTPTCNTVFLTLPSGGTLVLFTKQNPKFSRNRPVIRKIKSILVVGRYSLDPGAYIYEN